jgi:amino acid adenylation domain-containing protein
MPDGVRMYNVTRTRRAGMFPWQEEGLMTFSFSLGQLIQKLCQRTVTECTGFSPVTRVAYHGEVTPRRPAIIHGSTVVSYAELENRSTHIAEHLRAAGVGPQACVGLFFERSPDFVIAALAVLKAGAAYLPIDSAIPADRRAFMLSDSGTTVVLTHRGKARDVPAGPWRILEFEGLAQPPTRRRAPAPVQLTPEPDSLAYVIYTSGSSGRPKGVEITHANLVNLVEWHVQAFDVTPADRASQVAGLGFDAAVWEIWPHLAAGCSVHIADELTRRSPAALRDWLVAEAITISFVPTVLAEQLLHVAWPTQTALRTLLTGADTLNGRPSPELPFTLVNNYGPTECTVVATSGVVATRAAEDRRPSIGRPITNTTALILDDSLHMVTPGKPGELCLAGPSVGRGYRNNPDLTRASFVSVTLPSGGEVRVYRTGDRVRLLENGEIEFLGRADDQIKIRGYRVELGEIAAWLSRYPGITACTVSTRSVDALDACLVGYVVVADGATPHATDIRNYLSVRLPDYMIPTSIVSVASLPTTPNGKIDRAALPAPTPDNLLPGHAAPPEASPTDDLQQRIGALVTSLLYRSETGYSEIDAHQNFFLLGGHSMLGVQLVSRIRQAFGVKLTLRQLFGGPTVAAVSAEVERLLAQTPSGAEKVS